MLSYVLLRLPREQAAAALDERVSGRKRSGLDQRLDQDAADEDAENDR